MKEINGVVYADTPSSPLEVVEAKAFPDMILLVTFNNGEQRLFNATILLGRSAFEKLSDENIFSNPIIEHGVVTWDNGNIDYAPETMYANSFPYNQKDIISA